MGTSVCVSLEYDFLKQGKPSPRVQVPQRVEIKGFHVVKRCCQIRRCRNMRMFSGGLGLRYFFPQDVAFNFLESFRTL